MHKFFIRVHTKEKYIKAGDRMVEEIMYTIQETEERMEEIRKQAKRECERISLEGEEWIRQYELRQREELDHELEQKRSVQSIQREDDEKKAKEQWEKKGSWLREQAVLKERRAIDLILKQLA